MASLLPILPLALWAAAPAGAQTAPAARAPERTLLVTQVVEVPIDHAGGHVALDVHVNGEGPYRFNLDTGAAYQVCLDESLAQRLDLRRSGSVRNTDGTSQNVRVRPLVELHSLQAGGCLFTGIEALVDDYSWLTQGEEPVLGLLGFDLFAELLLTVDYPAGRLELTHGELPRRGDDHVMPYTLARGVPEVALRIGDRRVRSIVDTGSQAGLILPSDRLRGLATEGLVERGGVSRTVNNEYRFDLARLGEPLQLAGHFLEGVDAQLTDHFEMGILGYGLLRDFALTFDQRNRRLRLVRGPPNPALDAPLVRLPVDLSSGRPVVEARIDGRGPFRFAVHTGTGLEALLDEDLARRLDLRRVGVAQVSDRSGRPLRARDVVWVDSLELGGATFRSLALLSGDLEGLVGADGEPLAGLLGWGLFQELVLTLDFPARALELSRDPLEDGGQHVVPLRPGPGPPALGLAIGERTLEAAISSGSVGPLTLPEAEADRLPLEDGLRRAGVRGRGAAGDGRLAGTLNVTVHLAGHDLVGLEAHFSSSHSEPQLGCGVLGAFRVTLDPLRRLARLER